MKIEEIYAITPRPDGWRILPDEKWIKLGNYVTLGDNVTLGDRVMLGNYVTLGDRVMLGNGVTLGDNVTLGDRVMLGNYVTLGDRVKLGDNETSEKLNLQAIEEYKRLGKKHIFCKWVNKDRMSPFKGAIKYNVGDEIICFDAVVSDIQCAAGLHVFRIGFRPEWAGLCEPNHNLIKIDVEVDSEDICFAGVADMNQKLRVRKLKVLN